MQISADEQFKAAAHGLLLGCTLPVLAYNIRAKRAANVFIYGTIIGIEIIQILTHLFPQDTLFSGRTDSSH